jgi:hypothetical protein
MSEQTVEDEIVITAYNIGCSTSMEDLFDTQMAFWITLQSMMKYGGYELVRKRMSNISEDLANIIADAPIKSLRKLCSAELSTIRPSIPDQTIIDLLKSDDIPDLNAKMALQILSENKKVTTCG